MCSKNILDILDIWHSILYYLLCLKPSFVFGSGSAGYLFSQYQSFKTHYTKKSFSHTRSPMLRLQLSVNHTYAPAIKKTHLLNLTYHCFYSRYAEMDLLCLMKTLLPNGHNYLAHGGGLDTRQL